MPNYINPTPNPNLPLYPTIEELSYLQGAVSNIQQQIDDLSAGGGGGGGGGGGVTTGNLTEATSNVLTISGGTNAVVGSGTSIEVEKSDATTDGYLSATDWNTFNSKEPALSKGNLSESVSSVLTISGGTNAVIGSGASIEVKQASGTQSGYLASTDFNTFNGKQDSLVSGSNIKTINSNSLVGSGNVAVQDVLVSGTNIKTINATSVLGSGNFDLQDKLISGTNIKSINSNSLLGSGDLIVQDVLVSGTNIKTINSNSIVGSGNLSVVGYTLQVQALTSAPTDGQTIYFGNLPKAPTTTANISKVYIPKAGTIKRAEVYCYSGTSGTAESWSGYVRLNNTTDTLIATLAVNTAERRFSNTALNIAVVAGDYIEIKFINPTWATNPNTTIFGGYLWIE